MGPSRERQTSGGSGDNKIVGSISNHHTSGVAATYAVPESLGSVCGFPVWVARAKGRAPNTIQAEIRSIMIYVIIACVDHAAAIGRSDLLPSCSSNRIEHRHLDIRVEWNNCAVVYSCLRRRVFVATCQLGERALRGPKRVSVLPDRGPYLAEEPSFGPRNASTKARERKSSEYNNRCLRSYNGASCSAKTLHSCQLGN